MRIVIDATPLCHGSRAIRRHSKNLITALIERSETHKFKLLYIDRCGRSNRYLELDGVNNAMDSIIPLSSRSLYLLWRMLPYPTAEKLVGGFDVFYATDLYFPPSQKGVILGSVRGIAYHVIPDLLAPRDVVLLKKGLHYTLRRADYLLAVSKATRKDIIEYLKVPEERIYVSSHGIDQRFCIIQDKTLVARQVSEITGFSEPYILYVGVIGHHKNVRNLLEAYRILNRTEDAPPLVMAGPKGSAWHYVNRWIVKNKLDKKVKLTGHIDQDKDTLTWLYNGACLFVFPSYYEGWASPPLEAMACGTPVIVSNRSSLPETVGSAGVQVPPDNPEQIASEMDRVLSDTGYCQDLISKGLAHVKQHTWDAAAQRMNLIFSEINQRGKWRS